MLGDLGIEAQVRLAGKGQPAADVEQQRPKTPAYALLDKVRLHTRNAGSISAVDANCLHERSV